MASPLRLYCVSGLLIITACLFGSCSSVDICPAERYSAPDQLCQFIWLNRYEMTENIRDRLKYRPHSQALSPFQGSYLLSRCRREMETG